MIPLPQGVRGVACDRPYRHEEGLCEPVVAGAGGAAARYWLAGHSLACGIAKGPALHVSARRGTGR